MDRLDFIVGASERVLPQLDRRELRFDFHRPMRFVDIRSCSLIVCMTLR